MTNKSIALWLKGAAGVVGSLTVLGAATWAFAGPALNTHIKQQIIIEIGAQLEEIEEGQAQLQIDANQVQRTLGQVETKTQSVDQNVQLILRLLLEQQQRDQ